MKKVHFKFLWNSLKSELKSSLYSVYPRYYIINPRETLSKIKKKTKTKNEEPIKFKVLPHEESGLHIPLIL